MRCLCFPKRSKPTPNVMTSPTFTRRLTFLAGRPMSMTRSDRGVTLSRSPAEMRWIGLRPTMPRKGCSAPEACTSTRSPGKMAESTPPMAATDKNPSSETLTTIRPISSIWAASIRDGAAPLPSRRAWTEPMTSVTTWSATPSMRSRTTEAMRCSQPVGEGVSSRRLRYLRSCLFICFLY